MRLIKQVKEQVTNTDDRVKRVLQFLQKTLCMKSILAFLEKEITKAFVTAYEEQAESLFNNYLDHAEAYVNNTKVKDKVTSEDMEPDEKFLGSRSKNRSASKGVLKNNFRADISSYMFSPSFVGGTLIDWRSYGPVEGSNRE